MLSVAEARRRICEAITPLETAEPVALAAARGRVLALPLVARLTQPPFATTAMDGYALRAADCASVPCRLPVAMEIPAGTMPAQPLPPGTAARIFTGAPLPEGADSIVIQEDAAADAGHVTLREPSRPGRHIRPRGHDFAAGARLLVPPCVLAPADLALAAAAGHDHLEVRPRPRIALLATGDELVPPGTLPGPGQIAAASGTGVGAVIERAGGRLRDLGLARDTRSALRAALAGAEGCDLIVTLGGASVGDHDLMREVLASAGHPPAFWRIAMRPGKPLFFGSYGGTPLIGLPGNPVSALVCAELFVAPAVARLLGLEAGGPQTRTLPLAGPLRANDAREDYMRGWIETGPDGTAYARPFPVQDSSQLATLSAADILIVRPPHAPAAAAGDPVPVLLFRI